MSSRQHPTVQHNIAIPETRKLVRNGTGHVVRGDEIPVPIYDTMARAGPGEMMCLVCRRKMGTRGIPNHLRSAFHLRKLTQHQEQSRPNV